MGLTKVFPLGLLALGAIFPAVQGFYLPGSAPKTYKLGSTVPFLVNVVQPKAQIDKGGMRSLVSYDYYDERFHFCSPKDKDGPKPVSEGLGSALFGDRIYSSPITAKMLTDESCVHICTSVIPQQDTKFISDRIKEGYAINWEVDGLPVAQMQRLEDTEEFFYSIGFFMGTMRNENENGKAYRMPAIYNHFEIYLNYHMRGTDEYRIVGASVWPASRSSLTQGEGTPNCNALEPVHLDENSTASTKLAYTYSTHWKESKTPWATRWDHYLKVVNPNIHWLSLINAIVIAGFLCLMVSVVLMRSTNRDISRYEAIDLTEDVQEEFGWKLVHGEVFRPPQSPLLLSVMVGSGSQLIAMAATTLLFAALGFLSPSYRGSLAVVMIVTWTLFGALAGYLSSRVYASLDGAKWKRNVFLTATLFPTLVFATVNLLNFFLIASRSSGAVPFGTLLALVALWFIINIPLTLIGSYIGIRVGGWRHPVRVNSIPRQIPPVVWYLRPWPSAIIGGLLPFATAFLESFFMLNSLFGTKIYYAFGFLALTFVITSLTTATVSVLFCYFTLSSEDYRWHWRSFTVGGGSAFWLFAYGIFFWSARMELPGLANKVLFVGYLFLLSLVDFLLFGAIGYFACYSYIRRIYGSIRID
ncbi:hypothetical protein K437DRAFT_257475 [Tilletiaria anomala UBC 951]|uniref:Transmembrane 9 superfamily member n=1 Tax=Tilletiaria anomala (strain ATCC 24038 / CBS 436.72 / UBC 951) TaxID=1037660 RepID=A0A066VNW7_TILAU|nr:uncharacterized protein K437DRAFT_257475 [Tilletiaria anomala UBC 951]KDN43412.1 hypothetical protein K437DRAFT_257475 [Tilletiaria anomala UBC 951]